MPHPGARDLVRTGRDDWFGHGRVEAVRAALGIEPGSALAAEVGIPPTGAGDAAPTRSPGPCALALATDDEATADVGDESVTLGADGPYALGQLVARLQAALWCERLEGEAGRRRPTAARVAVRIRESGAFSRR